MQASVAGDSSMSVNTLLPALSSEEYQYFCTLAMRLAGLHLGTGRKDMLGGRIAKRVRQLQMHNVAEYIAYLQSDAIVDEAEHFLNAITTNHTGFFREPHHFEHMKQWLSGVPRGGRVRIWSAGCSNGMEPYSIAAMLASCRPDLVQGDCRILATDIDTTVLAYAAQGIYSHDALTKMPEHLVGQYFTRIQSASGDQMQANDSLRQLIRFNHLNLMDAWPIKGTFQAIFCRNVMIYFDKPTQKTLCERFINKLDANGFFYIGHSENIGVIEGVALLGGTIYQKNTTSHTMPPHAMPRNGVSL